MSDNETIIDDAKHVAEITRFQVWLVLREAAEAEKAVHESERLKLREIARRFHAKHRRGEVLTIDWSTGQRVSAEIIPFPVLRR
jgi:hypothetical protein